VGFRTANRRSSPRGVLVVLVGPDGVGKTTAARELVGLERGCTGYVHFRPPFWSELAPAPEDTEYVFLPKDQPSGSVFLGLLRISWSLVAFWAGYLRRIRPALGRGCLVVSDRWAYGYLAQPSALRFHGPNWVAELVVRLVPKPDLVVALEAPPEVVTARKAELSADQVLAEMERYRRLPVETLMIADAGRPAGETARMILAALGRDTAPQGHDEMPQ
jgi:thymidylate kinase